MVDIQATGQLIDWTVKGITILLLIVVSSLAIKKKNNIGFAVVLLGNMIVFFVTRSPLLCWIVSIAVIIWVSKSRGDEQPDLGKQIQKKSVTSVDNKKPKKIGNIIGLILGIGFVVGPLIGYFRQEASLSDPTTQGVLILFAVIGACMIMNNLFKLFEKGEEVSATVTTAPAATANIKQPAARQKARVEEEPEEKKIRCRFCKKLYSAEYNGCPYCKKK